MVVFIQNDHVKLGVNETQGGAICYLSRVNGENVINTWDTGRLLQQSYYGNSDGSSWNGRPWKWNPVQGGSWDNKPSKVISIEKSKCGREIITRCHPRNWGGCELCEDVIMTTHIKLKDCGKIHVTCIMTYNGHINHGKSVQEVPACFLHPKYSVLVYKNVKTNELIMVRPNPPGSKNLQKRRICDPTWAGYIDPVTKEGIFIQSSDATSLTAYRVDIPSNPPESNCSYLAPLLDNHAVKSGSTITYEYTVSLEKFDHEIVV